ncbi:hypothetical protein [Aneurinibacillus terranovensis]|nr:hypothetical protein [Aneurinibacillus terranovensis]
MANIYKYLAAATRSTSKKQRSAHSREFFSGDPWRKVYVALTL